MSNIQHLRRLRWAVRGTVLATVAVSVATNVLHALPNPISQGIAAWPPLALLLAIELISRIPATARMRAGIRIGGTGVLAFVAAWISYWHMVGTVASYGETGLSVYLWPLTVDGVMIVASVSLVELAIQIRGHDNTAVGPSPVPDIVPDMGRLPQAPASAIPAAQAVEEMRQDPYWGARLGRRQTRRVAA